MKNTRKDIVYIDDKNEDPDEKNEAIAEYIVQNIVKVKATASGGSFFYMNTNYNEEILEGELARMLAPLKVSVGWSKNPVAFMSWFDSMYSGFEPLRKFNGVVDLPYTVDDDVYNSFEVFAMDNDDDPVDAHIEFFDEFMYKVIGNSNKVSYDVAMTFFSQAIQMPDEKTNLALGMIGTTGVGKGSLAKLISRVVGSQYFYTAQGIEKVTGKFNSQLSSAYFIYANEVEGMNHSDYQKLKSFISEEYAELETKGRPTFPVKNRWRFILDGNDIDRFRSSDNERRVYYLDISSTYKGDAEYWCKFNLLLEDEEFLKSVYSYLNRYEYNREYLYQIPSSTIQKEVVRLSRNQFYDDVKEFIEDVDNIKTKVKNGSEVSFVPSSLIVESIDGLTAQTLHSVMTEINPHIKKDRIKEKGMTIRGYIV